MYLAKVGVNFQLPRTHSDGMVCPALFKNTERIEGMLEKVIGSFLDIAM